jgi:hypothetical protein
MYGIPALYLGLLVAICVLLLIITILSFKNYMILHPVYISLMDAKKAKN